VVTRRRSAIKSLRGERDNHAAMIEGLFVDLFLDAHGAPPPQIILDLDATDDPLHGHQEGRFFHGYYDNYCYLPLYIFCGRHLLAAKLRPANIDGSPTGQARGLKAHGSIEREQADHQAENRSHYVRDVSFFEDHSRIRTKPTVFARCRSFALNILRANGPQNISRELYRNALNLDHAMTYPIT
jgi:hypothetical protein